MARKKYKSTRFCIIDKSAKIGDRTVIWNFVNILPGAKIGKDCTIGSYTEIGEGVVIGDNCKIEAGCFIPKGVRIGDGVFVGPRVTFINDRHPYSGKDFTLEPTYVKNRASVGAAATIMCGVTIHERALVGAGSMVTHDVAAGSTVVGNPALEINRFNL